MMARCTYIQAQPDINEHKVNVANDHYLKKGYVHISAIAPKEEIEGQQKRAKSKKAKLPSIPTIGNGENAEKLRETQTG